MIYNTVDDFTSHVGALPIQPRNMFPTNVAKLFRFKNYFTLDGYFLTVKISRIKIPFWGLGQQNIHYLNKKFTNYTLVLLATDRGWFISKNEVVQIIKKKEWSIGQDGQYKIHIPDQHEFTTPEDFLIKSDIVDKDYIEKIGSIGQSPEEISNPDNYIEGAVHTISVNKYERNKKAREACLAEYGYDCAVCGFNFRKEIGPSLDQICGEGKNYIHVHHKVPLSELKKEYKVDPIQDLVPVCPNCHALLHMQDPPYTVEEIKSYVESRKHRQV